ncbi:MAG TPA: hypothetical protein VEO96_08270 [Thermoplasmata archaeon]|nr:hypothetical protein [Thermoplasmata archaeon]
MALIVSGPPVPQFNTPTIVNRIRDDIPPEVMTHDVPGTSPYAVWGMFIVTAIVVILFVAGYLLWK